MTTKSDLTDVVVVDGSNIATEGRSIPSLAQLNEAVMAFKTEFPDATVTVVVDATFGHRIDKSEVAEFDAAVAHNELVAPPAGAIGRGDAFVLSIANKVGARILSNDSFQEFHGDYAWLFDEGRLIGGKPVPFVGWVFVPRLPVKGPTSRKATRAARGDGRSSRRTASKAASQPMPVPSAPPPGRAKRDEASKDSGRTETKAASRSESAPSAKEAATKQHAPAPKAGAAVNELLPFIEFVEQHPVGSSVNGVVESYSSHGAYVTVGDLRGYVPLRLMGEPPPRRAREVMKIGDAVTLVVHSFAPGRRSVDLAVPALAATAAPEDGVVDTAEVIDAVQLEDGGDTAAASDDGAATARPAAKKAAARKSTAKKAPANKAPAKRAPARKTAAKQAPAGESEASETADSKTPATRSTAKRSATTKSTAKKSAAARSATQATEDTPATQAKRTAAKKTPAARTPAKKTAATKSPAKKTAATKTAAKKSPAKKTAAKKTAAKKTAAKKTAAEPATPDAESA